MPVAGLTSSLTSLIGNHGIYAVFLLMAIDAVLPAASELVMLYAGALAAGAFAGQHVDLFGARISSHFWAYAAMALAGTLGYLLGSIVGWAIGAAEGGRCWSGAGAGSISARTSCSGRSAGSTAGTTSPS